MITKEDFTRAINSLEAQFRHDEKYCSDLAKVLGVEDMSMYNNEELSDCIVDYLANNFIEPDKARAYILEFMYELDFGKFNEVSDCANSEILWVGLVGEVGLKDQDAEAFNIYEVLDDGTEEIFKNMISLIEMYRKNLLEKATDSERLNILSALSINLDGLKNRTIKGYESQWFIPAHFSTLASFLVPRSENKKVFHEFEKGDEITGVCKHCNKPKEFHI